MVPTSEGITDAVTALVLSSRRQTHQIPPSKYALRLSEPNTCQDHIRKYKRELFGGGDRRSGPLHAFTADGVAHSSLGLLVCSVEVDATTYRAVWADGYLLLPEHAVVPTGLGWDPTRGGPVHFIKLDLELREVLSTDSDGGIDSRAGLALE